MPRRSGIPPLRAPGRLRWVLWSLREQLIRSRVVRYPAVWRGDLARGRRSLRGFDLTDRFSQTHMVVANFVYSNQSCTAFLLITCYSSSQDPSTATSGSMFPVSSVELPHAAFRLDVTFARFSEGFVQGDWSNSRLGNHWSRCDRATAFHLPTPGLWVPTWFFQFRGAFAFDLSLLVACFWSMPISQATAYLRLALFPWCCKPFLSHLFSRSIHPPSLHISGPRSFFSGICLCSSFLCISMVLATPAFAVQCTWSNWLVVTSVLRASRQRGELDKSVSSVLIRLLLNCLGLFFLPILGDHFSYNAGKCPEM